MGTGIEIKIEPLKPALLDVAHQTLDVLIRVQAPDRPAAEAQRNRLNLALVIDRSSSMDGQPLEEAKRCAAFILDRLHDDDRVAVVMYDNVVDIVAPSTKASFREEIKSRVAGIFSRGSTALHAGWLEGAKQAAHWTAPDAISRVLLLSDGCANAGPRTPGEIAPDCAAMAGEGVTTSTYGLGRHFDETLMSAMAEAGRGEAYYGRTAEDLHEPFLTEFDLLSAICARRVRMRIVTATGVNAEVRNSYARVDGAWLLPDLAYGGESWALVKLDVSRIGGLPRNVMELLSVEVEAAAMDGSRLVETSAPLRLPILPADAVGALAESELVRRRIGEIEAAALQERAREAALHGDWAGVEAALREVERLAGDSEYLRAGLERLRVYADQRHRDAFSKEAHYKNRKLRERRAGNYEGNDMGSDIAAPSYVRRKPEEGEGKR